jgi:hypothetical protein
MTTQEKIELIREQIIGFKQRYRRRPLGSDFSEEYYTFGLEAYRVLLKHYNQKLKEE